MATQSPDISAGQRVTAQLLRSMMPSWVIKPSATTRTSTTTFADDPDMTFPVEADTSYWVEMELRYGGLLAADFKTIWTVPSGTSGSRSIHGPSSTANNGSADDITGRWGVHGYSTAVTYSGVRDSAANLQCAVEKSLVMVGSTAGNVTLQWAQATSNATGSVLAASSLIKIWWVA